MDALSIAAWQEANPHAFLAFEITLPAGTYRITSGGQVTFGGNTYAGHDDDLGALSYVGSIDDGGERTAALPEIGLEVFTGTGINALTATDAQGSPWVLYWGLVDPSTGAVVGTPVTVISGALNIVTLEISASRRSAVIESYSEEQFLLLPNQHAALSDAFHRQVWPGETGLNNVSGGAKDIYWRASEPPRSISGGGGGGGFGGGGGNMVRLV